MDGSSLPVSHMSSERGYGDLAVVCGLPVLIRS